METLWGEFGALENPTESISTLELAAETFWDAIGALKMQTESNSILGATVCGDNFERIWRTAYFN